MSKRKVLAFSKCLDRLATEIEAHYQDYGISQEDAQTFIESSDRLADFIMESNGIDPQYFVQEQKEALVLQHDSDEPYMEHFQAPSVVERDQDDKVLDHMMDMNHSEMHTPLEGETVDDVIEACEDEDMDEDEDKEASTFVDYWSDDVRQAQVDYWSDDSDH